MQELVNLVNMVKKRRHRVIEVFNEVEDKNKQTILHKFYSGIRNGHYESDDDASMDLYSVDAQQKKYQMLKGRLRTRLLETLVFLNIEQPKHTAYQEAYFECNKSLFFAKTLLDGNVYATAIRVLDHLLEDALKYNFTEMALEAAKMLLGMAYKHKTKYSFDKYSKILVDTAKTFAAETEAYHLSVRLQKQIYRSTSYKKDFIESSEKEAELIKAHLETVDSYNLKVSYHHILISINQMKKNFEAIIENCNIIQELYKANSHLNSPDVLKLFTITKLKSYIQVRDYENGIKEAKAMTKLFDKSNTEWFEYNEYYLLILMNSEHYKEAEELFQKIVSDQKYSEMPQSIQDSYNVFAGYLFFVTSNGWLDSKKCISRPFQKRYKVLDLMEGIPTYDKDRLGYNVSSVILRVLILFAENDFEGVYDTVDALHFYARRHLKRFGHERSNLFIHMLLKLIQHNFDYIRVRNGAEKFYMDLAPYEEEESAYMDDLEVMLYDKLWNYILTQLDSRPKRKAIMKLHY